MTYIAIVKYRSPNGYRPILTAAIFQGETPQEAVARAEFWARSAELSFYEGVWAIGGPYYQMCVGEVS